MWEQVHSVFVAHYDVFKDFTGPAVTLIGFGITAGLAFKGFNTFDRWKREKIEERRIDVAIDALSIGHEATLIFEAIRSRRIRAIEYDDEDECTAGTVSVDYPIIAPRKDQIGPYVVLKSAQGQAECFERAATLEPKYTAIFGIEAAKEFALVFEAKHLLEVTAEELFEECRIELDPSDTEGRDRRKQWREQIFASPGTVTSSDKIGAMLNKFRDSIETRCRPIVSSVYGVGANVHY